MADSMNPESRVGGAVSVGLTVIGFIPAWGQAAAFASIGWDIGVAIREIRQCN